MQTAVYATVFPEIHVKEGENCEEDIIFILNASSIPKIPRMSHAAAFRSSSTKQV